jgi:hypothetical protein
MLWRTADELIAAAAAAAAEGERSAAADANGMATGADDVGGSRRARLIDRPSPLSSLLLPLVGVTRCEEDDRACDRGFPAAGRDRRLMPRWLLLSPLVSFRDGARERRLCGGEAGTRVGRLDGGESGGGGGGDSGRGGGCAEVRVCDCFGGDADGEECGAVGIA